MIGHYRRTAFAFAVASALVLVCPPSAIGGVWEDIGLGLGYAGFDIQGQNNPYSGGQDYRLVGSMQGNPLDFGIFDMAFQGPISLEMSTGGRWVKEWEFHFQTATSSGSTSTPLAYSLSCDACSEVAEVTGTFLLDGDFVVNEFGCYDLDLRVSSRQTVTNDGRIIDGSVDNDYDIGPISVSGNIYADVLGVLFDPLFEAYGMDNPFQSFSGKLQLDAAMEKAAEAQAKLLTDNAVDTTTDLSVAEALVDSLLTAPSDTTLEDVINPQLRSVVPEPSVLLLMLAGLPIMASRRVRNLFQHT